MRNRPVRYIRTLWREIFGEKRSSRCGRTMLVVPLRVRLVFHVFTGFKFSALTKILMYCYETV